jgi:putative spermidine/putrescine transport system permease protein
MAKGRKRGRTLRALLKGYFVAFVFFLYGPTFCMFLLSFQGQNGSVNLPRGFFKYYFYKFISLFGFNVSEELSSRFVKGIHWGLYWWNMLFDSSRSGVMHQALFRSILLALVVMVLTAFFSTTLAMAFRQKFKGAGLLFYAFMAGLMVPGLLVSLGVMLLFKMVGLKTEWYFSGLGAQFIWTIPFGFLVMIAVFNRFERSLEEAAMDLGANKWTTLKRVTLPIIAPGILGAGLFGFTLSFDEFARTLLISGGGSTLPLHIYAIMMIQIEPILYALGTATTVISWIVIFIFLLAANKMAKREKVKVSI